MEAHLVEGPFSKHFVDRFVRASERIFGQDADEAWLNSLKWRLTNMPDVTVFTVEKGDRLIGYKAGHALAHDRYYSWLGGADPDYRRRGLGSLLMEAQHNWLSGSRFKQVETYVEPKNAPMVQLNMKHGFIVGGQFMKGDKPFLIMQKTV
jgi:ribosomal protein S18 acetylase RimI-like enzyme